jgi:hypothetical protein
VPTKAIHITVAACVVSTLLHPRGDKRADDVDLGTPTLILNSAAHCGLTTPLAQQELQLHGPYRNHIAKRSQLPAIMVDDPAPVGRITAPSDGFHADVESAGLKLKQRLLDNQGSATKTYGFDHHPIQDYQDLLEPVFSHKVSGDNLHPDAIVSQTSLQELSERHSGGKLRQLEILVSTKTIKHGKADSSSVKVSEEPRKVVWVWLLALCVDKDEKDKIGRSFRLGTRFDVVEGEIFISFEVV